MFEKGDTNENCQTACLDCVSIHYILNNTLLQSVPQDQKSVKFLRSIITLNQLLQHFKYADEVYLT